MPRGTTRPRSGTPWPGRREAVGSRALRSWLERDGGLARRLADAAYGTRPTLGLLDPEALLVLADALEEAGCDNPELLDHLRQARPHVAGCCAVDLLAGRE